MKLEFGTSMHAVAGFGAPGKPFKRVVAEAAETGFKHLMLLTYEAGPAVTAEGEAPDSFVNLLQSDIDGLMRTVSSHGLRVSSVYPGFGLFDLTPDGVSRTIERLVAYRDLAWRMGSHLMIHPAGVSENPQATLDQKKERIEALAAIMDGVASDTPGSLFKMAADIHYGSSLMTLDDCAHFLKVAKKRNSGLCLNMGHLTTSHQDGWTLVEQFPERIHVMAWKDHKLDHGGEHPVYSVELGTGDTPFRRYWEAYQRVDCDAIHLITFEDVPFEDKKNALRRSREYMDRLTRG